MGDNSTACDILLTVVVPSYNSQNYLQRCINSLLPLPDDVEIIIVNDGSTDRTQEIAEAYAKSHPDSIRVINKSNGGHGSGINTGIHHARGRYFKILDSDDWFAPDAYPVLLDELRGLRKGDTPDLVVANYVYEKEGKRRKAVIGYKNVLPTGRTMNWHNVGYFRADQYLLMHSLVYRTQLLRDAQLTLPEHTFYVDNLYAFIPMSKVRTIRYVDTDLYCYHIGRDDQSVNEAIMMRRIDQQLRVNRLMIDHIAALPTGELPPRLRRYMEHYLVAVTCVSSVLLCRLGGGENIALKNELWAALQAADKHAYRHARRTLIGAIASSRGRVSRLATLTAYRVARFIYGFN